MIFGRESCSERDLAVKQEKLTISKKSELDLDAIIEEKARCRPRSSEHGLACFTLFEIEEIYCKPYKPGGIFDENPYSGDRPLVGKIVLD